MSININIFKSTLMCVGVGMNIVYFPKSSPV